MSGWVSVSVSVYMCACVCMCVYMCVSVCVYVCMGMCMWCLGDGGRAVSRQNDDGRYIVRQYALDPLIFQFIDAQTT